MNYYNEFDPFAAAWLRELIKEGLIPKGDVDDRSIVDVRPDDLRGFAQCHFFAGIGGWSKALDLAGWPTDRPVWTGSCPCQPFSSAGNQKGKADERHLWPVWFNLIRECHPTTIFAEQVSSAVAHGWLDDVYQGLEAEGYACGAAVLPACSVGAPHKRDRLWFVAHTERNGQPAASKRGGRSETAPKQPAREDYPVDIARDGYPDTVADSAHIIGDGRERGNHSSPWRTYEGEDGTDGSHHAKWINCPDGKQRIIEPSIPLLADGVPNRVGKLRGYGNAIVPQVAAEFIAAYMEI